MQEQRQQSANLSSQNHNVNVIPYSKQSSIQCKPLMEGINNEQGQIKQQIVSINNESKKSKCVNRSNISMRVRNRRYKKLLQLRRQGFFDEQEIKLRHPLLYYLFVGQYEFVSGGVRDGSRYDISDDNKKSQKMQQQQKNSKSISSQLGLSTFLESYLVNLQYKKLLGGQMSEQLEQILNRERALNERQIEELRGILGNKKDDNFSKQQMRKQDMIKTANISQLEQQKQQIQMEVQQQMGNKQVDGYNRQQKDDKMIMKRINKLRTYTPEDNEIDELRGNYNQQNYLLLDRKNILRRQQQQIQLFINEQYQNQKRLSEQQRGIQEQHLIEYCEELFLQGKLVNSNMNGIDYDQIDNSEDYDDQIEWNRDEEQNYFDQIQAEMDQLTNNNQIQSSYYTGIQDY